MSVVEAVRRDLAVIRRQAPDIADSALAASAIRLAEQMDKETTHPTSVSNCARALTEVLDRLRALVPPAASRDDLDDLKERRATRRKTA